MNESSSGMSAADHNPHLRAWALIPWLVNGRATADERSAVEAHVAECAECAREYRFQRELHAAMQVEPEAAADDGDADAAFGRLLQRIDLPAEPHTRSRRSRTAPGGRVWQTALIAAVCVQAVAIAWLVGRLQLQRFESYQTLSAAPSAEARGAVMHLVVAPDMPAGELQALLGRASLQIVGGPTAAGVLALAPQGQPQPLADSLAVLRADSRVRFAERVDGEQP